MLLNISQIGQIALPVRDVDRSEAFYEQALGLRKLFRFGDLSFFYCAGVRLLIDKASDPANFKPQGCIYFRCADIALAVAELEKRGVAFTSAPDRQDGRSRSVDGVLHRSRRPHLGAHAGGSEGIRAAAPGIGPRAACGLREPWPEG